MIVLSFDVGIANLAYCVVKLTDGDGNEYAKGLPFEILGWEVIDLNARSLDEACRKLPGELLKRIDVLGCADKVIIERQTKTNVKMKVMSHALQVFFESHLVLRPVVSDLMKPMVVEFSSPLKKLSVYSGPPIACSIQNSYRRNKKMAIEHTLKILEKYPVFVEYFHALTKKDDAADALLHALVALHEHWGGARKPVSVDV